MTARKWTAISLRTALAGSAMTRPRRLRGAGARDRRRQARPRPGARAADERAAGRGARDQRDDHRGARRRAPLRQEGAVVADGVYTVRRPNRFHAKMTGGRGLESWYNGKTLTIASHPHKVFAQAPMPDTIDRALDALAERYDMPLPMGDLFYGAAEKALLSDTTTGGYAGTEKVGDTPCTHLAFHDIGRGLGSLAAGAGRPVAEAFQGRAEGPDGPARGRRDVHGLGSCPADRRRHVQAEGAGGLRGHRRPAARRGRQEERGR